MIGRAQYFEEEYEDGLNRLAIPGFPGAGRASFYLTLPMAIPVNAQEKEGAWAFLELLITEPLYAARSRGGWLPVQSDFEKKTDTMTDTYRTECSCANCRRRLCPHLTMMQLLMGFLPMNCRIILRTSRLPNRSQTASSAASSCISKKPTTDTIKIIKGGRYPKVPPVLHRR